jgi:hypothetical protein
MRKLLITATAFGLLLTACGTQTKLESTLKLNDDPGSALLIVRDEGGFVPIDFQVRQGPRLVLLRDGSLITPGPQIEIFPGPLVPNYQKTVLDEDMQLFVLEELDALDFDAIQNETNDEATNSVADAPTTVTTFFNQDGAHVFSVYALGIGTQVSDGRIPILANLVQRLSDVGFSQASEPYVSDSIQVMAGVSQFPTDPQFANVRPWPLPDSFDQMRQNTEFGWRCDAYRGEIASGILTEMTQGNQATTWEENGVEYSMAVRPLFPGEEPCLSIGAAG